MTKDELLQTMARNVEQLLLSSAGDEASETPWEYRVAPLIAQAALTAIIEAGYAVVPEDTLSGYRRAYRWFSKWPEYTVAPEYMEFAVRDFCAMRKDYEANAIPPHEETAMIQAGEIKP